MDLGGLGGECWGCVCGGNGRDGDGWGVGDRNSESPNDDGNYDDKMGSRCHCENLQMRKNIIKAA